MFITVLGALIGSFANVVIYRLPAKKSIVWPGSSCPGCGHKIRPWENIPILSWLFLRGKCSACKTSISIRYPLIELLSAGVFFLLAWRWPLEIYDFTVIPLLIVFAMIIMMSWIDIDHYILPDSLTLPATIVAILGTLVYAEGSGLPTLSQALMGAAIGAGIIALINRVGSLVVRRFADTKERLWPIGMDQVNIAAVAGALGGWLVGVIGAAVSISINLISRRTIRLPELPIYTIWLATLLFSLTGLVVSTLEGVAGTFIAAGVVSIAGATFWWLRDVFLGEPEVIEEDDEPVAMGFGDVKLAAVLGALLGWQALLVALLASFVLGSIGGVISRILGGNRLIPFGPYLALGGLLALFYGQSLVQWYLGMLGI